MIEKLLSASLFLIPLICVQGFGDGIRLPKEMACIIAFISIIGYILYNFTLKKFKHKWLLIFWAWCCLTLIVSNYQVPIYLTKVVLDMPSNLLAYKEIFYLSLVMCLWVCLASVKVNLKAVGKWIAYCVILISLYSLIQAIGLDEFFRAADNGTGWLAQHPLSADKTTVGSVQHRTVGTLGNPSILAIWLSFLLPLLLFIQNRVGYIAFILALIVIGITNSAMAVVGAIIGISLYLLFNHRKILIVLIVLSLLCIPLMLKHDIDHKFQAFINPLGRIEVHKEAFKVLQNKAITGMGLGTFEHLIGNNPQVYEKLNNQNWKELHDEYGQVWFTTGLIGLSLFMISIFSLIGKFFRKMTDESIALFCSLSAFLVISIGYFTFRVAPISYYGVILTGLFLSQIGED